MLYNSRAPRQQCRYRLNGTSQEADSHAEPEAQTQELHADLTKKKAVPTGTAFFFVVFL